MATNMSNLDRALRMLVGIVLIALALGLHDAGNSPQSNVWWGWFGIVPLATAFFSWCPFYRMLGISTCKRADGP